MTQSTAIDKQQDQATAIDIRLMSKRASDKKYRETHKEEEKKKKQLYRIKNKEKIQKQKTLYWLTHKEQMAKASKKHYKKIRFKKYGIDEISYNNKLISQNNNCAICGKPFTETPSIDHNHVTGEARGLLCSICNPGLGLFKDDPRLLREAASYLEKWNKETMG